MQPQSPLTYSTLSQVWGGVQSGPTQLYLMLVSPVCEDVHVVHLHADLLAAALVPQQLRHGADVVVLATVGVDNITL